MSLFAGYNGWYRAGQWVPLRVFVDSTDRNIDGFLQVRVNNTLSAASQLETVYRTPFNITAGTNKEVFLYVSLDDFTNEVTVEFVDSDGRVAIERREPLQQLGYDDILYAVVTDSSVGVLDVSRERIGRGESYQVRLGVEDIPPNVDALRSLDALVFTDVNSAELSSDQQMAVQDWVFAGGYLLVTGGSNWQRTTSGLLDILPAQPTEVLTVDDISVIGEFVASPNEDLAAETLIAASTPIADADVLLSLDDTPLVVRREFGAGTVDFVAFDATVEPMRSWDNLPLFWYELLISAQSRPSWTHGIERFELARDAISQVTGFSLPSILEIAAFLITYIVLIGPVNYIILRTLGRRELAWFSIPILIGAFSVFAYFTGFASRGDAVTVNQISVIQVTDDYDRARVDGIFGILSPRRTTYDVTVSDDLTLRTIPNIERTNRVSRLNITQSEIYSADEIAVDAAIMTGFATSGYVPAPEFDGSATWTLQNVAGEGRVAGTVTNPLAVTLENAVVIADDEFTKLGDIAAGKTVEFNFTTFSQQPARLTLGNRVDAARPVLYPGNVRTRNDIACLSFINGVNMIYEALFSGEDFNCTGGGEDDDLRGLRRSLMVSAMNNELDRNTGRGTRVYLMGWSESPDLMIDISDTEQAIDGTQLYIYEIPTEITFAGNDEVAFVPPGMFTWTLIEQGIPNRLPEISPDLRFQLLGDQGVAIRFTPLQAVPIDTVEQLEVNINWRFSNINMQFSLWNWQDGNWQVVPFADDSQTQFIIENMNFVGPNNAVQVLVESINAASNQSVQNISVALRGRR